MKISIVTVCYNSEKTILDTMLSVNKQSFQDYEHIIYDGGSNDSTLKIIKENSNEKVRLFSEPDKGLYDAMNKAILKAKGSYLGFLNSDDTFKDQNSLSYIAENLTDQNDCVYGNLSYTNQDDQSIITRKWISSSYFNGRMFLGWMPAHPTFYCKTSILKSMAGFDLSLPISADYDLMFRLFEIQKISSKWINKELILMREGGNSGGGLFSIVKQNFECVKSRNKARKFKLPIDLGFFLKPISKLKQFYW